MKDFEQEQGHSAYDPCEPDYARTCTICGCEMDWQQCWQCHGEGGFHDCGEDCCACIDPDDLNESCDVCDGEGGCLCCPNASNHPPTPSPVPEYDLGGES